VARQLKIDLEELGMIFSSSDVEAYLNRRTGEILFDEMLTNEPDLEEYIEIPHEPSSEVYDDIAAFIEFLADNTIKEKLSSAIQGKGAFRRFKDVLREYPIDQEKWFAFSAERLEKRMRDWLESEDIEAV
jgi:hypothetical protein